MVRAGGGEGGSDSIRSLESLESLEVLELLELSASWPLSLSWPCCEVLARLAAGACGEPGGLRAMASKSKVGLTGSRRMLVLTYDTGQGTQQHEMDGV